MAEPGWYPDPEGGPGRLRYWDGGRWTADTREAQRRRAPLIALFAGCLAVAVVIVILVVVVVRGERAAVPDSHPPAATVSGWNDSGPATPTPSRSAVSRSTPSSGTPTSSTPSASSTPTAAPSHRPSPRASARTISRPAARCPAGEPDQALQHRADGRVHGGQLSFAPVSGAGFGRPQADDHYGWWYDEHDQTAPVRSGATAGRTARVAVGAVAIQAGFRTPRQSAQSSMRCLVATSDYAGYTGRNRLQDKEITVNHQRAWQLITEIEVRGRHGSTTGDRVRLIVVDAGAPGSYSIFVGVSPIGDHARQSIIDQAAADLRVGA